RLIAQRAAGSPSAVLMFYRTIIFDLPALPMSKRAAPPATPPVTPSATLPEGAEAATPRRARGRPAWAPYGEPTRAMRIPESLVPA
ncbi:hypothetical protein ACP3W1_25355, partial [Salmonella enterica]|uniref:hypothetical protein n=1 Tax=Salmonella enterica TaxID=28901 RepID=UPI003CEA1AB1